MKLSPISAKNQKKLVRKEYEFGLPKELKTGKGWKRLIIIGAGDGI
jgi:hypothetical protein